MKCRKKPIVVDYFPYVPDGNGNFTYPHWFKDYKSKTKTHKAPGLICLDIETLEGVMTASPGDFIIRGVSGEIYPIKSDIFEKTYDRVEE